MWLLIRLLARPADISDPPGETERLDGGATPPSSDDPGVRCGSASTVGGRKIDLKWLSSTSEARGGHKALRRYCLEDIAVSAPARARPALESPRFRRA